MMPLVTCQWSGTKQPLVLNFSDRTIFHVPVVQKTSHFCPIRSRSKLFVWNSRPLVCFLGSSHSIFLFGETALASPSFLANSSIFEEQCWQKTSNIHNIPHNRSNLLFLWPKVAQWTNFFSYFEAAVVKVQDICLFHPQIENFLASCSRATTHRNASCLRPLFKTRNNRHNLTKKHH